MARQTKKKKTDNRSLVLPNEENANAVPPVLPIKSTNLDTILASVFCIFAARGKAIRQAREKKTETNKATSKT
jgi:hypothetical protein